MIRYYVLICPVAFHFYFDKFIKYSPNKNVMNDFNMNYTYKHCNYTTSTIILLFMTLLLRI